MTGPGDGGARVDVERSATPPVAAHLLFAHALVAQPAGAGCWAVRGESEPVVGLLAGDWVVAAVPCADRAGDHREVLRFRVGASDLVEAPSLLGLRALGRRALSLSAPVEAAAAARSGDDDAVSTLAAAIPYGLEALGAVGLGIAEASLARASVYARERRQFGAPIVAFGGVRAMLDATAEALERCRAARAAGAPPVRWALDALAMSVQAADRALQVHGGMGYTTEVPIERFLRDAVTTEALARRLAGYIAMP